MKNKNRNAREFYIAPLVVKVREVELEQSILAGSVVNDISSVRSTGQTVEEFDFTDAGFNSSWEE